MPAAWPCPSPFRWRGLESFLISPARLGTENGSGLGEPARSTHVGGILIQHVQPAGVGAADVDQGFQEAAQQFFEIARFQLDAEQLVKRLRFGLADLVIGVVQSQDDAEVELLANPAGNWRASSGISASSIGDKHQIVLFQRFQNRAGRQVQLGQTAAVVFHLLDEFERRMALRQNPGGGAGGDRGRAPGAAWARNSSFRSRFRNLRSIFSVCGSSSTASRCKCTRSWSLSTSAASANSGEIVPSARHSIGRIGASV